MSTCGLIIYFVSTFVQAQDFPNKKVKRKKAAAALDVLLILWLVIAAPMAFWLRIVSCHPAGVAVPTKGL